MVVNTPRRNAEAVAELTIALMLSLARRVPSLDSYVKTGGWENPLDGYINHQGIELRGKTLGLVGLGAMGGAVSKLATSMGMEVLAFDPFAGAPGTTKVRRPIGLLGTTPKRIPFPLSSRIGHRRY